MASAEESPEYKASPVHQSFRVEWKIPTKAFTDSKHVPRAKPKDLDSPYFKNEDKIIENSKQFQLGDMMIGPFYLVLMLSTYSGGSSYFSLQLLSKGRKTKLDLEYALVCLNDRLLYLPLSGKTPPDYMENRQLSPSSFREIYRGRQTDITIVCGISNIKFFDPPKEDSRGSSDDIILFESLDYPYVSVNKSTSWSTSASLVPGEAFNKYLLGQLPNLNVDLAKDLLSLSSEKQKDELKALCVEYLAKNFNASNIFGILRKACDLNVKDLMEKCYDFIRFHCNIVSRDK